MFREEETSENEKGKQQAYSVPAATVWNRKERESGRKKGDSGNLDTVPLATNLPKPLSKGVGGSINAGRSTTKEPTGALSSLFRREEGKNNLGKRKASGSHPGRLSLLFRMKNRNWEHNPLENRTYVLYNISERRGIWA